MAGEPRPTKVVFRKWVNSVSWEREKTLRETCEGVSWRNELPSINGWSLANEEERGRHHVRPESWLVWKCSRGWEGQVSFTGHLKTLRKWISWV